MGTLGCINDMQRRDKENRELRKRGWERMKETRNRLIGVGNDMKPSATSLEKMEEIRKKTQEKEKDEEGYLFRAKLFIVAGAFVLFLLAWLFYSIVG